MDSIIYPVCVIAQKHRIWFAWRSVDQPECALLKWRGAVLWAHEKSVLIERLSRLGDQFCFEDGGVFDMDSALIELAAGNVARSDELMNCWNMLIDIRGSLPRDMVVGFSLNDGGLLRSYERFFSWTSGGSAVGGGLSELGGEDIANAIEAISNGMTMVLAFVDGDGAAKRGALS